MNDCVEITKKGEIVARIALNPSDLETEDLGHVLAKLKVVEEWIKEARSTLHDRLAFGDDCSAYHLITANGKRSVRDVPAAWARLRAAGVPDARLVGCVDMPIGRAEKTFVDVFKAANPGAGEAEALVVFEDVMGDAIDRGSPTKRMERSL